MFGLGGGEIFLIAVFALIFVGPKKLPELAKGLGKGIREFQKAKDDLIHEAKKESDPEIIEKLEAKEVKES
jgi:sec-independent protein translocase protein TatA